MNIWKITFNEIERGRVDDIEPVRVDPAIVLCLGDGLEACSILSDAVRGPRSVEDKVEDIKYEWEVIGIEVIRIELVTTVDHIDPGLRLKSPHDSHHTKDNANA